MLSDETIRLLYTTTKDVTVEFWDWRHNVAGMYFIMLAAVFALVTWFEKNDRLRDRRWLCLPFTFGAIASLMVWLMERTNRLVLDQCYRYMKELELLLGEKNGMFSRVLVIRQDPLIYTKILPITYISTFILFAAGALALMVASTIAKRRRSRRDETKRDETKRLVPSHSFALPHSISSEHRLDSAGAVFEGPSLC